MYNSRPRYARYGNYPATLNVPENYSGNAFGEGFVEKSEPDRDEYIINNNSVRENAETVIDPDVTDEEPNYNYDARAEGESTPNSDSDGKESAETECMAAPKKKGLFPNTNFNFNLGKLFSGGLGFEDLLIIGLIFLIAQSEGNEDIIVLLAILFFIG